MRQIIEETMFYTDNQHKINFMRCIEKFGCINQEYASTCYIASHPEIFKCFSLEHQIDGPFDWYFEHLASLAENGPSNLINGNASPLTGQTNALVRLGLNLWNGYEFDLAEGLAIWDSELYTVALQAINLRRHGRITIYEQIGLSVNSTNQERARNFRCLTLNCLRNC